MENYEQIIKRITEIINISNEAKKDNKDNEFVRILWTDILSEYAKEFQDLIDTERTFIVIANNKNIKNEELINECENKVKAEDENSTLYLELLEILDHAKGKTALDLIEYHGYIVLKNELSEFINICRTLEVGDSKKVLDIKPDEVKEILKTFLANNKEQFKRINYYMEKINQQSVSYEEVSQKVDNIINEQENNAKSIIHSQFKELIYLGVAGKLTIQMISELQRVMSIEEYDLLIQELISWGIFKTEELSNIKTTTSLLKNIDEVVAYFLTREGLIVDNLKFLIPNIGLANYFYLIDKLYKLGKIDYNDYQIIMSYIDNIKKKSL